MKIHPIKSEWGPLIGFEWQKEHVVLVYDMMMMTSIALDFNLTRELNHQLCTSE